MNRVQLFYLIEATGEQVQSDGDLLDGHRRTLVVDSKARSEGDRQRQDDAGDPLSRVGHFALVASGRST